MEYFAQKALIWGFNKTLDGLLEKCTSENFIQSLQRATGDWVNELPANISKNLDELNALMIPDQNVNISSPKLSTLLKQIIDTEHTVSNTVWLEVLEDHFQFTKKRLKTTVPFFDQGLELARPMLKELADKLQRCCDQNNDIFKVTTIDLLKQIIELINNTTSKEEVPKFLTKNIEQVSPSLCFEGRENDMDYISNRLVDNYDLLLVNGLGGIGKSYLCRHVFHHLSKGNYFDHFAWVHCKRGIAEGLITSGLYSAFHLPESEWTPIKLQEILLNMTSNTLLVLDDIQHGEEQDALLKRLQGCNVTLLATSRSKIKRMGDPYTLSFMSEKACINIFKKFGPKNSAEGIIKQLVEKAGRHTLTIELIARTAKANYADLNILLKNLNERGFDLSEIYNSNIEFLKDGDVINQRLVEALVSLFSLADLDTKLKRLLLLISQLDNAPFKPHEVKNWFGLESMNDLNSLIERGWVIDQENQSLSVHQTVGEAVLKQQQDIEVTKKDIDKVLYRMGKRLKTDNFQFLQDLPILLHIEQFVRFYGNRGYTQVSNCWKQIGASWYTLGEFDKSIEYLNLALDSDIKNHGEDHPDVAIDRNNLGLSLSASGQLSKALDLFKLALISDLKSIGNEHPRIAPYFNNIGQIYYNLGRLDDAIDHYKFALRINLKLFGEAHSGVAAHRSNLGTAYEKMGNLKEAIKYYKLALDSSLMIHGKFHPQVACCQNNLGSAYESSGKLDTAIEYYKLSLATLTKELGINHPETIIVKKHLINAKRKKNN